MLSGTELVIILVLALLLLGPQELPKVAKSLGKGMREFQKATNDLKSVVETELAKMEQDINSADTSTQAHPPAAVHGAPVGPPAVVALNPAPVPAETAAPQPQPQAPDHPAAPLQSGDGDKSTPSA